MNENWESYFSVVNVIGGDWCIAFFPEDMPLAKLAIEGTIAYGDGDEWVSVQIPFMEVQRNHTYVVHNSPTISITINSDGTDNTICRDGDYPNIGILQLTMYKSYLCEDIKPSVCGRSHITFVENCPTEMPLFIAGENAIYTPNVECEPTSKMTTLFSDGTLIINELFANREADKALHGTIIAEYSPFSEENPYNFNVAFGQAYVDDVPILSFDTASPIWGDHLDDIRFVTFGEVIKPASIDGWFANSHIVGGDFTNLDLSECYSAKATFAFCRNLYPQITVPPMPVVQYSICTFQGCTSLQELNLCSVDRGFIIDCTSMFAECSNLEKIQWDRVLNARESQNMFYKCESLVGENGTAYDSNIVDATYARPDISGQPGYFYGC